MIGTVPGFTAARLVAATDASLPRKSRTAGLAWLCTDGRWGMYSWSRPSLNIQLAEVRAAALLLGHLVPSVLLTDSAATVRCVTAWQRGEHLVPAGGEASVMLARAALITKGTPMQVQHVRAHCGHLLNEAADSLASIARSSDGAVRKRERAYSLVASFLLSWQQQEVA
jgi:ribonuclease HI